MANLLSLFGRLFGGKTLAVRPRTAEADAPELTDAQILREDFSPSNEDLHNLAELVKLIASPLGLELRNRLMSKIQRAEPGEDATEILIWALTRDSDEAEAGDEGRWTLCIDVDWRGSDEIEWQANEILATLSIKQCWQRGEVGPCPVGLLAFDVWLVPRGYTLMHADTGGDSFFAFVVHQSKAGKVLELAQASGARVESSEQFATRLSAEERATS